MKRSRSFVSGLLWPSNTDGLARLLLFLFPVFAVSIRHWVSVIFVLVAFLGIFTLKENLERVKLSSLETWLLALMALFFLSYVASSVFNGWGDRDVRLLEREIRFVLFIPLYFLIRRLPNALDALGFGAVLAIFMTAILAPIQAFYFGYGRDIGVYGPLFTGPITTLFLIIGLAWLHSHALNSHRRVLIAALNLAALVVAVLCSRSSMLGTSVVIFVYYLWIARDLRYLLVIVIFGSILLLGHESKGVSTAPQFGSALAEAKAYLVFQLSNPGEPNPNARPSIGTRLEMLRSLQYFIRDYPFWGVGGYKYQEIVSSYVQQGLVSEAAARHAHPHNVFAQVLVSKGLVGLAVFAAILSISILLLKSGRRKLTDSTVSALGTLFILILILMNLTESAMVLKGNYIACTLVLLGVFIAAAQQLEVDHGEQLEFRA